MSLCQLTTSNGKVLKRILQNEKDCRFLYISEMRYLYFKEFLVNFTIEGPQFAHFHILKDQFTIYATIF